MVKYLRYPSHLEEYVTSRHTTLCRYRRDGPTSAEQPGRAGPGGVGEGELALLLASVVREGWSCPLSAAALRRASIAAHLDKSVKLTLRHGCKRGSMVVGEGVRTRERDMPLSDFGAQVSCPCPSPGQCWRAGWHGYGESWSQWQERARAGLVPYQLPQAGELVLFLTWAMKKSWPW